MNTYSWLDLFVPSAAAASPAATRTFRVLRKRGEPLLLLPATASLAARALDLYPAQSSLARVARFALRQAFRCGMFLGTEPTEVSLGTADEFLLFLRRLGGAESFPPIAVLSGNPREAGRRFLILVFTAEGRPSAVVKAGIGQAANDLIRLESSFLKSVPSGTLGVPLLREQFVSDRICAFALDFAAGDSPAKGDQSQLPELMKAWLGSKRPLAVSLLPVWQRLREASDGNPAFLRLEKLLAGKPLLPALSHGDFTPWNVKVGLDRRWVVLDWERGQLTGPPAWDWFHFVIQPAILVEKLSVARLAAKIERLLISPAFRNYATAAALPGWERQWVLAYLLYCRDVIKPAEGLSQTSALLETLTSKWLEK